MNRFPDKTDSPVSTVFYLHSACGLLDADFRTPSLDYVELIKASRQWCKVPRAGQLQFHRAVFNLFAANQDDHSRNGSFVQDDEDCWQVTPFYRLNVDQALQNGFDIQLINAFLAR